MRMLGSDEKAVSLITSRYHFDRAQSMKASGSDFVREPPSNPQLRSAAQRGL